MTTPIHVVDWCERCARVHRADVVSVDCPPPRRMIAVEDLAVIFENAIDFYEGMIFNHERSEDPILVLGVKVARENKRRLRTLTNRIKAAT